MKMTQSKETRVAGDGGGNAKATSDRRLQLFGAFLVLLSAVAIAVVPTLARLAYDGGSDTLTVITSRSIVTAVVCFLVMVALGRPLVIRGSALRVSLVLGVLYAVHLYGLLGAVSYLPVNIVILIFYLHPLMVGVIAILFGREAMSWGTFGALLTAIIGLGLAVGFSLGNLNWIGMALALTAAVLATVVIIGGARAMKSSDSLGVTCYMMLSAAASLVAICIIQGDLRLPVTLQGWTGFGGVAIAYTIGTVTFFAAIPFLGAVRAAMISNLEPVLGILFAMAVLGEGVSLLQAMGIVLVIGSIFAMEAGRRPVTQ
jgi:drug/metabolite transporter (DMT)-like permease